MKIPFTNIWLRIVAVIMGLLLWVHVATEKKYNYEVKLPVSRIIVKDNLAIASEPPDSLTIVVSASGKHLLRQSWKESGLRINASQYPPGSHNFELTTANTMLADPGVISVEEIVRPRTFMLDIDYFDERTIAVVSDLIIFPDEGYAVKTVQRPNPPEVTVRGARSILSKFEELTTEQKEVTGIRNNIEVVLKVLEPTGYGLSIEPDSVTLKIEIVPVKTRLFEKIPIVVYNSPGGKRVKPMPATIDIEMTGPPEEINLLNRNALVASVNFDQLSPEDSAPIKIDCPSHFKVKRASALFVRLAEN
ncbi:MAG: CdaR family protein [Candidatus Zixiibacteriota bacterium]